MRRTLSQQDYAFCRNWTTFRINLYGKGQPVWLFDPFKLCFRRQGRPSQDGTRWIPESTLK